MKRITSIASALVIMLHLFSCEGNEEVTEIIEPNLNSEQFLEILQNEAEKLKVFIENQDGEQWSQASREEEQNAASELQLLTSASYSYLVGVGLTEEEIENEMGADNVNLILVAMATLNIENNPYSKFENHSSSEERELGCLIEALGLNAFDAIRSGLESGVKIAAKSLLKNIAKRLLGPIGVAITVAEFAWCMSR